MRQATFDDLGTPLFSQDFVTLDLETTGGSPEKDSITEIGALKSTGGVITGTFQTLVRPDHSILPFVELLTGISDFMVATAPPITEILPSLWEFLRGSILVAHNARFDATFLAAAFKRHRYEVPFSKSICTLRLARWLMKGETRNLKLDSLAASLGVATQPCHRAFPDARATHEIFHRLLELAGPLGVLTVEDLSAFTRVGRRPDTGKAALAARIPRSIGVYKFVDRNSRILYVGKAKNLRARVRSYFYGDERPRTAELVRDVFRIDVEVCVTELEAEVRELHLIIKHQPRYNRRGRRSPKAPVWLKITSASLPRIVAGRSLKDGRELAGPFRNQRMAMEALEAIRSAVPIPRCSRPQDHPQGCAFGQMNQCVAPCIEVNRPTYVQLIGELESDMRDGAATLIALLQNRMSDYSQELRYEDAATARDRTRLLQSIADKQEAIRTLTRAGDLIICTPAPEARLHVHAIRKGLLVAAEVVSSADPIDPERLFGFGAHREISDPLAPQEIDEMLIVWRYIGRAAAGGGWVAYCSGVFTSTAARAPRIKESRSKMASKSID